MAKPGEHRLQVILSPKDQARIATIRAATEATSDAEVIRRSLQLYATLMGEVQSGSTLMVRNKAGKEAQMVVLSFPTTI